MDWDRFDKFHEVNEKYLLSYGEGDNMATQIATAVNKLIYKWYNDGDVFDNTRYLEGWANDLSSYANWLNAYTNAGSILECVWDCTDGEQYERLLYRLAEKLLNADLLDKKAGEPKMGSVYHCEGPFKFEEYFVEDEDEY